MAINRGECELHASTTLSAGKNNPVLIDEVGWVPQLVWAFEGIENLLFLPEFEPQIVQPIALSQYYATQLPPEYQNLCQIG
jgi:hypothetical protein